MRFVHVVKMQKMVNIDKQKKKLYFDEHLVLVLFSSQISSHCFIYLDLQDFGLLRLRGLPWILQVQSTGFPSKKKHFCNIPSLEKGYYSTSISHVSSKTEHWLEESCAASRPGLITEVTILCIFFNPISLASSRGAPSWWRRRGWRRRPCFNP